MLWPALGIPISDVTDERAGSISAERSGSWQRRSFTTGIVGGSGGESFGKPSLIRSVPPGREQAPQSSVTPTASAWLKRQRFMTNVPPFASVPLEKHVVEQHLDGRVGGRLLRHQPHGHRGHTSRNLWARRDGQPAVDRRHERPEERALPRAR